jgi:peptidyl-prolyl cis-trans isomerase B (cyclophilin B)
LIMRTIKNIFFLLLAASLMVSCASLRMGGKKEQKVQIRTTEGDITLKLYNETLLHRDNFIKLVRSGFYDDTNFHRVISEFMIQGGDTSSKKNAPNIDYTIPAEIHTPAIYHKYGALAAARLGDDVNPARASSGYQFYIVVGRKFTDEQLDTMQTDKIVRFGHANDSTYKFSTQAREAYKTIGGTPHLDGNYTIFGEVLKGMDVVERISRMETNAQDRPITEVRILSMRPVR